MFSSPSPSGGNLHPSVVNKFPAAVSPLSYATPGRSMLPAGAASLLPASPAQLTSPSSGLPRHLDASIDETEARTRAREILQDFMREKAKAVEVEGQLHRAVQENEHLQSQLRELKAETLTEMDRLKRQVENLRVERAQAESRAAASGDEAQKVAKASAQRIADAASQMRLKEQELEHLEDELGRARTEIRNLRKELHQIEDRSNVNDDFSKAQYRVVELARKLLEAEKEKTSVQKALVEDRKQLHQALGNVDSLRQQLADAERRGIEQQQLKEKDVAQFQLTIEHLHHEMTQQRELYQSFVSAVSRGDSGVGSSSRGEASAEQTTQIAVLQTQLAAISDARDSLQSQLQEARSQYAALREELNVERSSRIEVVTNLHNDVRNAEQKNAHYKTEVKEYEKQAMEMREKFSALTSLYEDAKGALNAKSASLTHLETVLADLQQQHNVIATEMEILRNEFHARVEAEKALSDAIQHNVSMEQRMREQELIHQHDKELIRLQFLRNGPAALLAMKSRPKTTAADGSGSIDESAEGAAAAAAGEGGDPLAIEMAPHMDLANLQHRVAVLEAEKARWDVERVNIHRAHETEVGRLQDDLRDARRQYEELQVECGQLKSQALHAQREVEEWRLAFHHAERTNGRLQHQLGEARDSATLQIKKKGSADVQVTLLSQHVDRLETQADRDSQELFRLRRELVAAELTIAKQRLTSQIEEIQRTEREEVPDAATAMIRERELIQMRIERQSREKEVHEKELALQRLHELHLADIAKSIPRKQAAITVADD